MSSLFFDLSVDAKEFMLGNAIFFGNVKISKDDVYNSLILPSNILDKLTNVQKLYLGSLCIITRRVLDDHLEDENIPIQIENIPIQAKQTALQNVILEFLIDLQEKNQMPT